MLEHLNEQSFDWLSWRRGSIIDVLGVPHRSAALIKNADLIRKYAVGFCAADNIPCRPKQNFIAVMFNTGGLDNWWTHLTKEEFNIIFEEGAKK